MRYISAALQGSSFYYKLRNPAVVYQQYWVATSCVTVAVGIYGDAVRREISAREPLICRRQFVAIERDRLDHARHAAVERGRPIQLRDGEPDVALRVDERRIHPVKPRV